MSNDYRFYYPDGTKIDSVNDFLDFYKNLYFWNNSLFVEEEIIKLYKKERLGYEDVFKILAWKIGKIKHKESQINKTFIFHAGWEIKRKTGVYKASAYNKTIDIKDVTEKLLNIESGCEEVSRYLDIYKDVAGIGPVYAIALMSFNTKGMMPIYDRFAMAALKRIDDKIVCKDPTFENMNSLYNEYFEGIKRVFSDYSKDGRISAEELRMIDWALWSYGHVINMPKN